MCGEYPASRCSPTKWFHFLGDAENSAYVPFQINYIQHASKSDIIDGYAPIDPKTVPCSSPLNVCYLDHISHSMSLWNFFCFQDKTLACSCSDCEASCPIPPPEPPLPKPFTIAGFDAFTVIMLVVFLVGTLLFLMGVCLFPSKNAEGKLVCQVGFGLVLNETDSFLFAFEVHGFLFFLNWNMISCMCKGAKWIQCHAMKAVWLVRCRLKNFSGYLLGKIGLPSVVQITWKCFAF